MKFLQYNAFSVSTVDTDDRVLSTYAWVFSCLCLFVDNIILGIVTLS